MATTRETTVRRVVIEDKVFIKSINDYRYKVITALHWTCRLTDSESGIYEDVSGNTHLQYPDDVDGFVEYADLTKTIVSSWLNNHPDIDYKVSRMISAFNKRVANATNSFSGPVNFDDLPD